MMAKKEYIAPEADYVGFDLLDVFLLGTSDTQVDTEDQFAKENDRGSDWENIWNN